MTDARITRRAALAGIGGGALVTLSGCFLFEDDDDDSSSGSSRKKSKSRKKK